MRRKKISTSRISYTMVKKSDTEISNVTYNPNGDTNKTMKPMKQVINEWSHLNASNPSPWGLDRRLSVVEILWCDHWNKVFSAVLVVGTIKRCILPGGGLGLVFAGYVPLVSQSPYPITVYFLANHRPHLGHFWANVISRSQNSHFLFMYLPWQYFT